MVSYIPSSTVGMTFSRTKLHNEIEIYGLSFPFLPYLMPFVQRYNSLLFGHIQKIMYSQEIVLKLWTDKMRILYTMR